MRAKRGLNRAVKDAAFAELRRQLEYKAAWYGRTVVVVERWFPSSKLCSICGTRNDALRLHERRWRCRSCGIEHDRNVNAARNIEAEGLRILMHPENTGGCTPLAAKGRESAGRPERCRKHRETTSRRNSNLDTGARGTMPEHGTSPGPSWPTRFSGVSGDDDPAIPGHRHEFSGEPGPRVLDGAALSAGGALHLLGP